MTDWIPNTSTVEGTAFRRDLIERAQGLLDRVEDTAPEETDERVAREVRSEYRRLEELHEQLTTQDEGIQTDELEEIERYVDELEEQIDEHVEALDKIDTLQTTVEELEDQISDREAELEALDDEIAQLTEKREEEIRQYRKKVGALEKAEWAYDNGYSEAQEEYQITIPCGGCGEPMVMMPGSGMHRRAVQLLGHYENWRHQGCSSN